MKVLLISPVRNFAKGQAFPPLGIMSIAAFLRENGHTLKIWDRDITSKSLYSVITGFNPDIIGISTYTGYMLKDAIYVSKKIKKITKALLIWGGVHPTLMPEECLKEEYIDAVILGEGEYVMLEIIKHIEQNKPLETISGIGIKTKSGFVINQQSQFVDLNKLPIPAWDLVETKKYFQRWMNTSKVLRMYSSKGCPMKCTFCYNSVYHKSTWRGRSDENLINEIKYLKLKFKIKGVGFTDDLFTYDKGRLETFCNRIISENLDIKWYCNARVGLSKEELSLMKKAGCKCIYFGIESGSKRIHKLINKGISEERVIKTFDYCKELNISTVASFIIGFPEENEMDIKDSVRLALRLKPSVYDFSIFTCYPGTGLFDYSINKNLFEKPQNMDEWIEISSWDKSKVKFASVPNKDLSILCDYFTFKTIMNTLFKETNTIIGFFSIKKITEAFSEFIRISLSVIKNQKTIKKYKPS